MGYRLGVGQVARHQGTGDAFPLIDDRQGKMVVGQPGSIAA